MNPGNVKRDAASPLVKGKTLALLPLHFTFHFSLFTIIQ
jgi:hypothetical protein